MSEKSNLTACPSCGRSVSRNAAACPGCGEPIAPAKTNMQGINMRDPVHVIGVALAVLTVVVIVIYMHDAFL